MSSVKRNSGKSVDAAAKYAARALIVKAMAHPSRLLMLDALEKGPLCVCELRDLVGADISTISKHLLVMKNAGLVDYERRGTQMIYRLKVPCVMKFFGCVEAVMKRTLQDQLKVVGT
jgi:ArsR family transcriptional regulator